MVSRSPYCVGLFSSHLGCSLRIYPFCSFTLFQRSYLLGLFTRPAHYCLSTFCAPLLRFCSLQRLRSQGRVSPRLYLPGTLRSCAFSSLQRFSPPCGLSSLFHLETLMGFSFRAFSCKRLVASSCRNFVTTRSPIPFYRWLPHAHVLVLAVLIAC